MEEWRVWKGEEWMNNSLKHGMQVSGRKDGRLGGKEWGKKGVVERCVCECVWEVSE